MLISEIALYQTKALVIFQGVLLLKQAFTTDSINFLLTMFFLITEMYSKNVFFFLFLNGRWQEILAAVWNYSNIDEMVMI